MRDKCVKKKKIEIANLDILASNGFRVVEVYLSLCVCVGVCNGFDVQARDTLVDTPWIRWPSLARRSSLAVTQCRLLTQSARRH